MTTQDDDVEIDEQVLRRIANRPDYIDLNLQRPVNRAAFSPTEKDVDGISVFRELFTSAQQLAKAGQSTKGYYVVRLPVEEIFSENLSVIANPQDDQLEGHALIPEIKRQDYKDGAKKISKANQAKLARIINKNYEQRIVLTPDDSASIDSL